MIRTTPPFPTRLPVLLCYHPTVPLSWNEIRQRSIAFSKEWTAARSEQVENQTFWNEFFDVFGIHRRTLATFEEPIKDHCPVAGPLNQLYYEANQMQSECQTRLTSIGNDTVVLN